MLKPWTPISFEFFPPRSGPQREALESTVKVLAELKPEYFSVTFGAGGSSLDATHQAVLGLQRDSGIPIAPHISCKLESRELLSRYLTEYADAGVRRLVVLRGDRQQGESPAGPFHHANELVEAVRDFSGDQFSIEVACYPEFHPESESPEKELQYFKRKVEAGATGAITQYFYNVEAYFRFIAECEAAGITIPIRPGILPMTNRDQLLRFSSMCGAEVPRWILKRLESYADDLESIREFGLDVVTHLCQRLLAGGAPGLHIYTLNQSEHSMRLIRRLTA
jgi:methylenetetrahydrofolate reductase (NADPH)